MLLKEAIILAGGLGTRLRAVVPDLPKCMAPIGDKPFLYYVMTYFQQQGISKFILSLGFRHELVADYLQRNFPASLYRLSVEKEPLGTGGAIRLAGDLATEPNLLVINGDTLFTIDVPELSAFHDARGQDCTICLKPTREFSRYGAVELNTRQQVVQFHEKKYYQSGLINGGVYALRLRQFLSQHFPQQFSFENAFLEKLAGSGKLVGLVQDKYFIDIGIPEDYQRAQSEIARII